MRSNYKHYLVYCAFLYYLIESYRTRPKGTLRVDVTDVDFDYEYPKQTYENFRKLGFDRMRHTVVTNESLDAQHLVFVSGVSANHFKEILPGIASVQYFFPKHRIYVYDLGLQKTQRRKLACVSNVVIRKIDFLKYPPFVQDLKKYYFKFLLIADAIRGRYSSVFWFDHTIRLNSCFPSNMIQQLKKAEGLLLFSQLTHNNYAVTHPSMFVHLGSYTPMSLMGVAQFDTSHMLFRNTRAGYIRFFRSMLLCSMTAECLAPTGSYTGEQPCNTTSLNLKSNVFWCHLYEQSLLNILLLKAHKFETEKFRGIYSVIKSNNDTMFQRLKQDC